METTLIILKPDAVQRGLIGRIVSRFEDKGLTIVGLRAIQIPTDLAERLYEPHLGKPFYPGLIQHITSGPVVVMAVRGVRAVEITRKMMGSTFGYQAEPGTIRGDFGAAKTCNLVHGSDSPETADRELALFFKPEELLDYQKSSHQWVFKPNET